MRYLVLLVGDGEVKPWSEHTEEEQEAAMGRFAAFDAACSEREGVELLAGEALGDPRDATVMRTRAGTVELSDGPYAEAIEGMGGFYLVEAPDLDVLVELLRVLPPYDIQIHPTVEVT
ncbi:YciI family protein [Nocardioides xinjiangensis]|uniref:YciI family protein n=1 Tax=Nocardioides xinjiangensis TaxID=2817376 RepID=UPI001B30CCE1|nr:YciI family protein [Nocardioides sp. SYSU D00778]